MGWKSNSGSGMGSEPPESPTWIATFDRVCSSHTPPVFFPAWRVEIDLILYSVHCVKGGDVHILGFLLIKFYDHYKIGKL